MKSINTGISFESQVAHGDLFLSCFLLIATLEGTEQQEEKKSLFQGFLFGHGDI